MVTFQTLIASLPRMGPRFLARFKQMGITTVRDLLWHFPTRYEDFSLLSPIAELTPGKQVTVRGVVQKIETRRAWKKRKLIITEAEIADPTGSLHATWFNQPFIQNVLKIGTLANFSGVVTFSRGDFHMSHPTYEILGREGSTSYEEESEIHTKHTGRLVPIYPETRGLTSKGIRFFITVALDRLKKLKETIPVQILEREQLPEINTALRDLHFPNTLQDAEAAKKRFAFEDLFLLQLFNLNEKHALSQQHATPLEIDLDYIKDLLHHLPFTLTETQKRSLWEILKDMSRGYPMNRLLQGDVGSGKTIIAALAALHTAHHGFQSAFMAPTEILARQHYQTFCTFFPSFEGGVALLTGSEAMAFYGHELQSSFTKKSLLKEIDTRAIHVVIGTHALIQKQVAFPRLSFVVVDEQHRFGVEQRAALLQTNNELRIMNYGKREQKEQENGLRLNIPHFLSMSATPIPRTLSMTVFGDLDVSLITETPKNRKQIITQFVPPKDRDGAYTFIREEVRKGRQVFVVCPRIEPETEDQKLKTSQLDLWKLDVKSVKEEYEKLSKAIFPDLRIAMLHGKMKPQEKEKIMKNFIEKKFDILVSTSVIEVGVDVPNATIMMIEGADRFGLAQLHQFRGRVGRGEHQSYCFLLSDSPARAVRERLLSIVEAKNGFELAEKDLKIRGPGQFLGAQQSGRPDIVMKALQNPELVRKARAEALSVFEIDPTLGRFPLLRERVSQFQRAIHWE